jgi:hypothetical protein
MNELTADSGKAAVLRGSWRRLPVVDRGEGIYLELVAITKDAVEAVRAEVLSSGELR